jgi:hypothetical protein
MLDRARVGHFTIAPENVVEARQRYEPDTAVLETELRCRTGIVQVVDGAPARVSNLVE